MRRRRGRQQSSRPIGRSVRNRLRRSRRRLRAGKHAPPSANDVQFSRKSGGRRTSSAHALQEQRLAEIQARRARKRALRARVGELVATAQAKLEVDPVQSVEAALQATGLASTNAVEDALRDSLGALQVRGILNGGGGAINAASFSPDGSLAAIGSGAGFLRVFRADTHAVVLNARLGSAVNTLAFSANGGVVAAGTHDGRTILYDVRTGTLLQ